MATKTDHQQPRASANPAFLGRAETFDIAVPAPRVLPVSFFISRFCILFILVVVAILLGIGIFVMDVTLITRPPAGSLPPIPDPLPPPPAKNVIFFIVDGCGQDHYTLSRWYKDSPLSFDGLQTGLVKTFIADSVIADSAPAASAYATGVVTNDKLISVGPVVTPSLVIPTPPEDVRYKPYATLLEAAKLKGKAVGVVATSRVSHATPAAFISHSPHRSMEYDIMEQGVYQHLDVMFGGGSSFFSPRTSHDAEDLAAIAKGMGAQVARNRTELEALVVGKKAIGIFDTQAYNDRHLCPESDRLDICPSEPSLEDMVKKAIGLLSANPNGFFVMIEGSQVDFASHANDARMVVGELLQYDAAAKYVLEWAAGRNDTLIVLTSDHNTGGLSIGNWRSSKTYPETAIAPLIDPLKTMQRSAVYMGGQLGTDWSVAHIQQVVLDGWGFDIPSDLAQEIADLYVARPSENKQNLICEALSQNLTLLGWTTHGHAGGDVPLFSWSLVEEYLPRGLFHHTELNAHIARVLDVDLAEATDRLFVESRTLFSAYQVSIALEGANNRVLVVSDGAGKEARIPANKNLIRIGTKTIEMEGITVYIAANPTVGFARDKFWVPRQALDLILANW